MGYLGKLPGGGGLCTLKIGRIGCWECAELWGLERTEVPMALKAKTLELEVFIQGMWSRAQAV